MAFYAIQATFGRGELSPKLASRADLEQFKMGLGTCTNFTVMRQGGIRRRPGTQFVQEVADSSRPARLIPFIFSAAQAYVLVFCGGVVRVYTLGGRVGTVEFAHPYADDELFELDYDQTNDVLDITHRNWQPRRISRYSETDWRLATVATKDGPYLPINDTTTIVTPSGTGNVAIGSASASSTAGSGTGGTNFPGGTAPASAFDSDPTTTWASAQDSAGWIAIALSTAKAVSGYSVQAGTFTSSADPNINGVSCAPKAWTFEGSNDGTTWTVLDNEFAQINWSGGEKRYFTTTNTTAYSRYRLNIAGTNGAGYIAIAGIAFTESDTTAAGLTLTASAAIGINHDSGFSASDVGRSITVLGADSIYHYLRITAVLSATQVTAILLGSPFPSTQGTQQWRLGAWGTAPGWPAHVCTFEGRKAYARTDEQPSGIWATKSGGYGTQLDFSISAPVQDDDAITFELTDVNEIQWIAEGADMLIGTAGAARIMGRDSANLPFSATNFRQSLASTYASQAVRPVKVGGSTIFVSTFGKALREFAQSDNGAGYDTPDISVLSEHLFLSGVLELAYAQEPDSVVWAATRSGALIGLTFEKAQAMAGMHRHLMGGGGAVESVASIPGADRNEVWLIVRRVIGGETRRYIERMAAPFEGAVSAAGNAWFLDCALQYAGAPVNAVAGLDHLEGLTVSILADGAREDDQVVTGGGVPLASGRAAGTIIVGLPFVSTATTLPSPLSQGDGSGLGRRKKIVSARLDLMESTSIKAMAGMAPAELATPRRTSDPLGNPPSLYSGYADVRPEGRWSDDGRISIIADGPRSGTILSLTLALEPEP